MHWHDSKKIVEIPDGFIPGMFRGDNGESQVTHLYEGTFSDVGNPMCQNGWHYGDSYSIFRNNVSKKGICKVCLRRARLNLYGVNKQK